MNRHVLAVPFLLFLLCYGTGSSQSPSPYVDGALIQSFPLPTVTPPLTSDMPFDVMIGYIIGDSAARSLSIEQRGRLLFTMTYSDTLRYVLKYLWKMVDYDPVRFYQWGSYRPTSNYYPSPPAVLHSMLLERAEKVYPDAKRTVMLSTASVIVHVRVNSTQDKIDTKAVHAKHAVLVTTTVVEPIKGQRIPKCWIDSRTKGESNRSIATALATSVGDQPATPGACLQFEYRLEWTRLNHSMATTNLDSTLVDSDGKQWVQPNTEYIVFLDFTGLGRDASFDYAVLTPAAWFGTTCSMYPIKDGKVYDPYDDFGFGTGLTPEQFKAALHAKINSITNP
jgi:hypothetical protein